MTSRISSSVSLLIHACLLAALSLVTYQQERPKPDLPGMELELIDVEHAMPLPDPVIPQQEASPAAAEVGDIVPHISPPQPSLPQPPVSAPPRPVAQSQPVSVPKSLPEQAPDPKTVEAKQQFGLGPVASAPKTVAPAAAIPASTTRAVSAPQAPPASSAPSKPRLDSKSLSRMLAAKAGATRPAQINSAAIGSAIGRAAPRGAAGLTVRQRTNLEEMIRAQITPCWNPPVAEEASGHVVIVMRIRFERTGAVSGSPSVSSIRGHNGANAAYARALSGSVLRAVMRCAPLKLPTELYEAWADVELNFDPRDIS